MEIYKTPQLMVDAYIRTHIHICTWKNIEGNYEIWTGKETALRFRWVIFQVCGILAVLRSPTHSPKMKFTLCHHQAHPCSRFPGQERRRVHGDERRARSTRPCKACWMGMPTSTADPESWIGGLKWGRSAPFLQPAVKTTCPNFSDELCVKLWMPRLDIYCPQPWSPSRIRDSK